MMSWVLHLGHQRLSIIDVSSAGNQPMKSSSGNLILTYNGEIYNHLDIRKDLEKSLPNINGKEIQILRHYWRQ